MLHTYSKFLDGLVKVMKLIILVASIVMIACMAYHDVMYRGWITPKNITS